MKANKKELEYAVLFFAKGFGLEELFFNMLILTFPTRLSVFKNCV